MEENERVYNERYERARVILADQFKHHPPKDDNTADTHQAVRENFLNISAYVAAVAEESPERAKALDALRLAMMWTNSAVAIHGVASVPYMEDLA